MFIGKWKEQSPSDVINNKRDLDELIFTYQPFLSKDFVSKYFQLESELFKSYNGWGMDAKLRTVITNRPQFYLPKDRSNAWDPVWDASFTGEDNTEAIRKAYSDLVSALPRELGIPDLWEGRARPISINDVAKSHAPPKNSTKSD
jgi:hypothetical protein